MTNISHLLFCMVTSSNSFGWDDGGKVTLCEPIWHALKVLTTTVLYKFTYLLTYPQKHIWTVCIQCFVTSQYYGNDVLRW